jgi:hypothetical protein
MMMFDHEPISAEEAILWHLEQIDYHAVQETLADGSDLEKAAAGHAALGQEHAERLAFFKAEFPETYRMVSADYERAIYQKAEQETHHFENEPKGPRDAIVWHLDCISYYEILQGNDSKHAARIALHRARIDELEQEFPAASVNARAKLLAVREGRKSSVVAYVDEIENLPKIGKRRELASRSFFLKRNLARSVDLYP